MKKLLFIALVLTGFTGCQTAGQIGNMSRSGMGALSCEQIYAAFNAYKQDRQSVDAWMTLITQVNPDIDLSQARALTQHQSAAELYQNAQMYSNVALAVQGCQPL